MRVLVSPLPCITFPLAFSPFPLYTSSRGFSKTTGTGWNGG